MPKITKVDPNQVDQDDSARKGGGVYPYGPLATALKLGDAVYACGGSSGGVPKSVIAQKIGARDASPSFYQQIGTAKCFGIVEGKASLALTEAAKDYYMPMDRGSRRRAELTFFSSPEAFQMLIKRFDGHKLPEASVIANILIREKIAPASWALRVGANFISTALELGILDATGILRFAAQSHTANSFEDDEESSDSSSVSSSSSSSSISSTAGGMDLATSAIKLNPKYAPVPLPQAVTNDVWAHPSGMRVEVPDNLTAELWERLNRHVQSLKPTEQQKGGSHESST